MKIIKGVVFCSIVMFSCEVSSQAMVQGSGGMIYINKNENTSGTLKGKRGGLYGKHFLGDTVGLAYDRFLKLYVEYESSGGAYATEKKIIHKKVIYDVVTDIEKSFKKQLRKDQITEEEAKQRLGKILNVVNKVRFYDTSNLEDILELSEGLERKEEVFNLIRIE